MKKTITVNLNGRVFTMDEDAFRLLDNYLNNLRIYFRKEEGSTEIIADFEARIEELFSEKIRLGFQVITIDYVEEVIARVGKPDDFVEKDDTKEEKSGTKEEKQAYFTEFKDVKKKFYRNPDDKMFGGICSGLAAYFGWDVLPVRIIFIVLIFATSLWIVPFYLVAWIFVPVAFTAEQKLQMRGKPITVENIGRTVSADAESASFKEPKGCLAGFIDLFVGLMKVFLIGLGCLFGFPLLFALIIIIIVLFAVIFGVGGGLLGAFPAFMVVDRPVLSAIAFIFVLGIPLVVLIYSLIAHLTDLKPLNRSVKWTFLIVWILALFLSAFSGLRIDRNKWTENWHVNWGHLYDRNTIRGDGIPSEKTVEFNEPVEYVEIGKNLIANFKIEQIQSNQASIIINGDKNLIDQVKYVLADGRLKLMSDNPLRSENNLTIRLLTIDIKGIKSNFGGNVQMNHAFLSDELAINMSGPSRFSADSLLLQSLTVRSEGIASVRLSGKANKARLELSGTGKIDALELLSDTVYARLEGIGSIQCNPVDYLEGRLQGIGKITYKYEPKVKNITSEGIGKIGKE